MLTNGHLEAAREKLRRELERSPGLAPLIEPFETGAEPFELLIASTGLELATLGPDGTPGRCRMKLFRPREGKERLCAFFYERSNLDWSRDRFSYGAVEFRVDQVTEADARSWLAWLVSGFDPAARPKRLRRAFLYDIPE